MLRCVLATILLPSVQAGCDARSLISKHEGKRDCVYTDTKGHPTVGIGYNLDNPGARQAIAAVGADYDSIRSGKTCLTDSQVMKLFEPSYQSAVAGARRAVSSYDQLCCEVQNVMTDMDYNLGDAGFGSFHGFISLINSRSWSAAAADGKGTAWCGQVGSRCTEDMAAVREGCGGPAPSPPSPPGPSPTPPSSDCCSCVENGGGKACVSRCLAKSRECQDCISNAGGKACGSRCGCADAEMTDAARSYFQHLIMSYTEEATFAPFDQNCQKPGDCGRAYQACCEGFAAKGYPCGCHLQDGTGIAGSSCGDCGTAYLACCVGFQKKGFPCTCDVEPPSVLM